MNQYKGTHVPPVKNRSSKDVFLMTPHCKSVYRSMNNHQLTELAIKDDVNAKKEAARRRKKRIKKA